MVQDWIEHEGRTYRLGALTPSDLDELDTVDGADTGLLRSLEQAAVDWRAMLLTVAHGHVVSGGPAPPTTGRHGMLAMRAMRTMLAGLERGLRNGGVDAETAHRIARGYDAWNLMMNFGLVGCLTLDGKGLDDQRHGRLATFSRRIVGAFGRTDAPTGVEG